MMELDSRRVEDALDMPSSTLRSTADRIFGPKGGRGIARLWSIGELVLIVVAQDLADSGFSVKTAHALTREIGIEECTRLMVSESAKLALVATPKAGRRNGFTFALARDFEELADLLAPNAGGSTAIVIDVRKLVENAFRTVAAAVLVQRVPADG